MKVYAIRDRMLDFYNQPFVGPNDKAVMASVAQHINNPGATDAIAQAPQHFELYALGEILEDGQLVARKEFLGDCSSLIRPGLRAEPPAADRPGGHQDGPPGRKEPGPAGLPGGRA